MNEGELREAIESTLGAAVAETRPLSGGSINAAWWVRLDDGRSIFVKANADAPKGMFATEVAGLRWLEAGLASLDAELRLRIPKILALDARAELDEARFLALEYVEPGPPAADFDERLGRGLAALHGSGRGLSFGLDHDNFIGSLPQENGAASYREWPGFYRDYRLLPMLERAGQRVRLSAQLRRGFDRLFDRLDELCGDPEPPARLHGDLWAGNLHRDGAGLPVLIDPAVYAGHREMDLAMMRLFGGFSPRTFAAYEEVAPLGAGAERRVGLYQLYPLLVHVALFGASYLGSVERELRHLI